MSVPTFNEWFFSATGFHPRPWQARLGAADACPDRLLRIPTGQGKTLGVVTAWLYHRHVRNDAAWPRRLVFALPMRALVEQTAHEVAALLERTGLASKVDSQNEARSGVALHTLMGGVGSGEWHLAPEQVAVLVGTQDMLLSRALNRGYGCARPRWPMEFALLDYDCLWIADEVQLMGTALSTSTQLQVFRSQDQGNPSRTWWMSATLQPAWFGVGHSAKRLPALEQDMLLLDQDDRSSPLFSVSKAATVEKIPAADDPKATAWAELVAREHQRQQPGDFGRITLAICNTVKDAQFLFRALGKQMVDEGSVELQLIHSRFRGNERAAWAEGFLSRRACAATANRIIVATQVVEAGVDISAGALVTQLAPWASLIQRFGRCVRYGGVGRITIVDRALGSKSAPYDEAELDAASLACAELNDVGPSALDAAESSWPPERLAGLYPYFPLHLLLESDRGELFSTDADLTGTDIDVSRFIRDGDDRDVFVFWADVPRKEDPAATSQPTRAALCRVAVPAAANWLLNGQRLKDGARAWVWDYLTGRWLHLSRRTLFPGQTILVDLAWGGYDTTLGFTGDKPKRGGPTFGPVVSDSPLTDHERAELSPSSEELSQQGYKTIGTHGAEAAEFADKLALSLKLSAREREVVTLAALLHDVGKAHEAFVHACAPERREMAMAARLDLAKAPSEVWRRGKSMFADRQGRPRRGFRHELASVLMLLEWVRHLAPKHPALLGPHQQLIELGVLKAEDDAAVDPADAQPRGPLAERLLALEASDLNLVLYLICAHHGKVRGRWTATPRDQELTLEDPTLTPIRGVMDGDSTPSVAIGGPAHQERVPAAILSLAAAAMGLSHRYGASWNERIGELLRELGPGRLALLETVVRVADVRASRLSTSDPRLADTTRTGELQNGGAS